MDKSRVALPLSTYGHRPRGHKKFSIFTKNGENRWLLLLCFWSHGEGSWLFSSPCIYKPYFQTKKGTESHHAQKAREGDKVSEPSFQGIRLCNVVAGDVRRFTRCLLWPSTERVKVSRRLLVISLRGDKISNFPRTTCLDEQKHTLTT